MEDAIAASAWPRRTLPTSVTPISAADDITTPLEDSIDLHHTTHRLIDTGLLLVELAARMPHPPEKALPVRVLDVGGTDFGRLAHEAGWEYVTIDLAEPQTEGTGGHQSRAQLFYDGHTLPFGTDAFDIVILSFVLHHAADNALALLRQSRDIASSWVVVGEDLAALEHPRAWHERNFAHEPGGIFRSDEEWRSLFVLHGLPVTRAYNVRHRGELFCELSDTEYASHVYRVLYVLRSSPGNSVLAAVPRSSGPSHDEATSVRVSLRRTGGPRAGLNTLTQII